MAYRVYYDNKVVFENDDVVACREFAENTKLFLELKRDYYGVEELVCTYLPEGIAFSIIKLEECCGCRDGEIVYLIKTDIDDEEKVKEILSKYNFTFGGENWYERQFESLVKVNEGYELKYCIPTLE